MFRRMGFNTSTKARKEGPIETRGEVKQVIQAVYLYPIKCFEIDNHTSGSRDETGQLLLDTSWSHDGHASQMLYIDIGHRVVWKRNLRNSNGELVRGRVVPGQVVWQFVYCLTQCRLFSKNTMSATIFVWS